MAPPTGPLNLDVEAISGICGSISIACWVVVFSPQIVENFRRGSADGLSLQFIIVWLLGDVFNILGAVLQGVLPTMIILAIYYTIADIVLLGQCFYYRGFTWRDEVVPPPSKQQQQRRQRLAQAERTTESDERSRLLPGGAELLESGRHHERRGSGMEHLSPAVPLISAELTTSATPKRPPPTRLQSVAFNSLAILMVCAAGVAGWFLSRGYSQEENGRDRQDHDQDDDVLTLNLWGQIFGWLCAVLYLGSRLPQLLLNWRRKSTEGVSMLFFLFACLGNLTYVLSIFAFEPKCHHYDEAHHLVCEPGEAKQIYGRYMLVNLSWLAGSAGTLLLDLGIFAQFFIYNRPADGEDDVEDEEETVGGADDDDENSIDGDRWDQRPLLQRDYSATSSR